MASDTWHYQNGLYFRTDEPGVTYAKTDNDGDSGWIKTMLFMAVNSDELEVVATHLDSGALAGTRFEPAFGRETPLWVGGIVFPEDGCWQISFTTTTATMTMVMNVIFVEEWGATPES